MERDHLKDISFIQKELEEYLYKEGARLVGFADLRHVPGAILPTGISVAIPLPPYIIKEIRHFPTKAYYDLYLSYNKRLDQIVLAGADFLTAYGFHALANTTKVVKKDASYCTILPHKTVATRAGLGWIGKNCLLVTSQFGSAVRISSLLTDAPFHCANPITESQCRNCTVCVRSCPSHALKGTLWKAGMKRDSILDIERCIHYCDKTVKEHITECGPIQERICGKCFAICAMTQKYVSISAVVDWDEKKKENSPTHTK